MKLLIPNLDREGFHLQLVRGVALTAAVAQVNHLRAFQVDVWSGRVQWFMNG